ncbi:hypothetical protein Tdes44962_MAKER06561, partial [Teratosphaeria destructans]
HHSCRDSYRIKLRCAPIIVILYCASSITIQFFGGAAFRWLVTVALPECAASIPAHVALIRGRRMGTQGQAATDPGACPSACYYSDRALYTVLRTRDGTSEQASSHLARPTQSANSAQKFLVNVGCDDSSHDAEFQLGFTCVRLLSPLGHGVPGLHFQASLAATVAKSFGQQPRDLPRTISRLPYSALVSGTETFHCVDFPGSVQQHAPWLWHICGIAVLTFPPGAASLARMPAATSIMSAFWRALWLMPLELLDSAMPTCAAQIT